MKYTNTFAMVTDSQATIGLRESREDEIRRDGCQEFHEYQGTNEHFTHQWNGASPVSSIY